VGWSDTYTVIALIGSLIALVLFIIVELRQEEPLLELRSFRSFDFTKGIIVSWINQIALFGSILLIPLFLQQVRAFSSFESGLLVIPQAVMAFIAMMIGGKASDKIGTRPIIFAGLLSLSAALYLLSGLQSDTSKYVLISRVTPLISTGQQVFVSFAVAIMTGLLTSNISKHMSLGKDITPAEVAGFHDTFLVALILALCGIVLSLFLSKPKAN
jgi:predicted MFS family arabinose efflux permease